MSLEKPQFHYRFFCALANLGYMRIGKIALEKALSIADVLPWRKELDRLGHAIAAEDKRIGDRGACPDNSPRCHFKVFELSEEEFRGTKGEGREDGAGW